MRWTDRIAAPDMLGVKLLGQLFPDGRLALDEWAYRTPLEAQNVVANVVDVIHLDGLDVENPVNPVHPDHPDDTVRIRVMVGDRKWSFDCKPTASLRPLPKHHEACGECGEVWPCSDERLDREAARMTHELDDVCNHCGKRIGGAWSSSWWEDGVRRRFHTAKKYRANGVRCFDAYERAWKANQDRIASEAP